MNIINKIACRIIIIVFFVLASACNTVPTSSSSSTAGSPPPGSSSSSSSSSSSGTSAGSPAGSQSTSSSAGAGKQSSASRAGSQGAGEEDGNASQTGAKKQGGEGEKSDDEILADALGEFDREINRTRTEAGEQDESNNQATGMGSKTGTGSDSGEGAQTSEEKARQLDEQLNRKFAKFDNLMLGEREKVAKGDNEAGSGNGMSGMGDGLGDGDGGDGNTANDPLQTAMANGSSTSGSLGVKSTRQVDSISEAPADVGNGQDDDIIARQLREAAQKERDPELRAKLWDEYRKYKKGA